MDEYDKNTSSYGKKDNFPRKILSQLHGSSGRFSLTFNHITCETSQLTTHFVSHLNRSRPRGNLLRLPRDLYPHRLRRPVHPSLQPDPSLIFFNHLHLHLIIHHQTLPAYLNRPSTTFGASNPNLHLPRLRSFISIRLLLQRNLCLLRRRPRRFPLGRLDRADHPAFFQRRPHDGADQRRHFRRRRRLPFDFRRARHDGSDLGCEVAR